MVHHRDHARNHPSHDELEPRPRLVLRFALYTGAVLLAAAFGSFWVVDREVAGPAQRTVETQARALAQQNLRSQLRASDFVAPVTAERRAQLDRVFRNRVLVGRIVASRLVNRDGTITYAALHRLIGTTVPYRSTLHSAFAGHFERRLTRTVTWQGEPNVRVLQALMPVRSGPSQQTIGVLELDQDYRAVAVSVHDARNRLALLLGLALLLLYVALFPILHRVTRQLEARNRRLREHVEERGQLLTREREARAEAESAQRLLAAQNDRLRELDRLKDEFISLVSHELRTPLTSIRGYLELLLEDDTLGDEHRRFLGIVDRNSVRLLDLVSDLLFLAQADAGKLSFELGPVDLEEIVRESVESSLPAAERQGVELAVHIDEAPAVQGDRARLVQVLDNLISNALKFTPGGGRVEVRLSASGDLTTIEVEDTGHGIAEAEQAQLFERFFRSSYATRQAIPGSGLGLTISKAIVERHGGLIELESVESVGTTVRVRLPVSADRLEGATRVLAA